MQIRGKTKVRCLVRNTRSRIYYARTWVKGKLQWKTLKTDVLTVAQADKTRSCFEQKATARRSRNQKRGA